MTRKIFPAFLLLTALLVSCGSKAVQTPAEGSKAPADANDTALLTETAVPDDPARISDLPAEYDLGGYEFVMLKEDLGQSTWQWNIFAPEEETGDLQNDACFRRNSAVSEQYNCVIQEAIDATKTPILTLRKYAAAGDTTYSACLDYMSRVGNAAEGGFYNLYDLPNINPEKAYWNRNMVDALTVRDTLYVVGGDILITDDDCIEITLFNHALAADLNMENLYDAVKNGTWTLDKMISLMKTVAGDLNGDSKLDVNDRIGLLYADNADAQPYFAGARTQLFTITDGNPAFTANDERAAAVFDRMNEVFSSRQYALNWTNLSSGGTSEIMSTLLNSRRVLFINLCLSLVRRYMRDVEVDFGLLPMPKLDEAQAQYATCIHQNTSGIFVPISAADPEKTGFILEALAAASADMSDIYYNVCMESKYTRDAESYDMVRLSLDNIIIDPGFVFGWGSIGAKMTEGIASAGKEYTSLIASAESAAQKAMEKFLETVESNK